MSVTHYIHENIERSINEDEHDRGFGDVKLPFRYTSPSIRGEGQFDFFFYWDTHFTQFALYACGYVDVAKDNIRNMLWLIDRHGFVPNYVGLDDRSQSPYLCRMVRDYFNQVSGIEGDIGFFRACAEGVRKEYHFWRTARFSPIGLCRYAHNDDEAACRDFYDGTLVGRLDFATDAPEAEKTRLGGHYLAGAEASCDFTLRFTDGRCLHFCQPDLNALLFEYERTLAQWAPKLGWDPVFFTDAAELRKERINRFLWSDDEGLFLDYDFVHRCHSVVPALTGYQTMYAGIATDEQAARMISKLSLFEREHGIAYTPDVPGCRQFQWAFPNVWPPMVSMMISGLLRYGYDEEALRIAAKYVATTDRLFERTGQLWEKTDAETGGVARGEYNAAAMIGWTAGVYLQAQELLH